MKRLIVPIALSVCTTLASAENVTVFIPREGGGVTQKVGNITLQEAALLLGDSAPPEGATGVVLERRKPARWTNLPPQRVNEAFVGEGLPATEGDEMTFDDPHEEETEDLVFEDPNSDAKDETENDDLIFEEPEEEPRKRDDPKKRDTDDKTDLAFEGAANERKIKPLAGNWVGIMIDQTVEGCPSGVAKAVKTQASALDLSVVQGDISPSFDPAVSMPQFSWETRGPNSWIGDMDMTQGGAGMRVQWSVRVMSPTLINGRQQIDVVGPMMGGCKISLRFQYERTG
jgi:hypothetical protein